MFYYVTHIRHVNNIHWNTHWKRVLIKKPNYKLHPLFYPCLVANCLEMSILPTELNVIHNRRGFWNSCNRMFSDKAFMVAWQSSVVLYLHFVNIYTHIPSPSPKQGSTSALLPIENVHPQYPNNTHLVPQTLNTSKWKGRKLEAKKLFFLHCSLMKLPSDDNKKLLSLLTPEILEWEDCSSWAFKTPGKHNQRMLFP